MIDTILINNLSTQTTTVNRDKKKKSTCDSMCTYKHVDI